MRLGKWYIDFEDFVLELQGLIVHGLVPIITLVLSKDLIIPVTLLYLTYQLIDYWEGESSKEVQGDIVEYMTGLMIGALILKVI